VPDRHYRLARLAFVGGALKESDSQEEENHSEDGQEKRAPLGQVGCQYRSTTAERAEKVQRQHGATLAQSEIGEAMSGVVFPGSRKGKQAAAQARNGNQRGIENGHAENQQGRQPPRDVIRLFKTQLEAERSHQEAKKHCAAIAHEDFGGLEIPAKEPCGGPEHRHASAL